MEAGLSANESTELISLPGNPGLAGLGAVVEGIELDRRGGDCRDGAVQRVDLVVIGPEAPLAAGLTDALAPGHPGLRANPGRGQAGVVEDIRQRGDGPGWSAHRGV